VQARFSPGAAVADLVSWIGSRRDHERETAKPSLVADGART
jgi:hypothetical protein